MRWGFGTARDRAGVQSRDAAGLQRQQSRTGYAPIRQNHVGPGCGEGEQVGEPGRQLLHFDLNRRQGTPRLLLVRGRSTS
jgi:hypothetical protein